MTQPAHEGAPPKPLARPMLKLQVGTGCLAVLVAGAWLAPAGNGDPRSAPPPEHAAPLLEERTAVAPLDALTAAVGAATRAADAFAVQIVVLPAGPPRASDVDGMPAVGPGSGVLVGQGRILTHVDALPAGAALAVSTGGGRLAAAVRSFEPATGLVLLEAPVGAEAPATGPGSTAGGPASALGPGAAAGGPSAPVLVVGVGRGAHGVAGLPAFLTAIDGERYAVGLGAALAPGLPLFDATGRLLAIAGARGAGQAFAVPAALGRLTAAAAAEAPLSFGIAWQGRQGALAEVFGPTGVIVADVVEEAPAADVLEPGMLVEAIDGTAVDTTDAALAALRAAASRRAPASLTVRRRGERAARPVSVAPAPALDLWRRARVPTTVDGPLVGAVFAADVIARSGIDPSARLVAIDGRPVRTVSDARRWLRGRPSPVVAVLHDGRGRFVAALEPPR